MSKKCRNHQQIGDYCPTMKRRSAAILLDLGEDRTVTYLNACLLCYHHSLNAHAMNTHSSVLKIQFYCNCLHP